MRVGVKCRGQYRKVLTVSILYNTGMAERGRRAPKDAVGLTKKDLLATVLVITAYETDLSSGTLEVTGLGRDLSRLFRRLFTKRPLDADVRIMGLLGACDEEIEFDKGRNGSGPQSNHRNPKHGAL